MTDPRHTISSPAASDSRYRFSSKELSEESGEYDFGARFLDPVPGRFITLDPLAEKYYNLSPYAYCAGNPINLVDFDGMGYWLFDESGRLVEHNPEYTDADVIQIVNHQAGQEIKNSLFFICGTVHTVVDPLRNPEQYPLLSIEGEDNAKAAFMMLANSSDVEWSYVSFNNGYTPIIGNSYEERKNGTLPISMSGKEAFVKEAIHSHPLEPYPSRADKTLVSVLRSKFQNNDAVFSIFHVISQEFITYNEFGPQYDERFFIP